MKGKALNAQKKEITTAFNADCGRKMILWLKYIGERHKASVHEGDHYKCNTCEYKTAQTEYL